MITPAQQAVIDQLLATATANRLRDLGRHLVGEIRMHPITAERVMAAFREAGREARPTAGVTYGSLHNIPIVPDETMPLDVMWPRKAHEPETWREAFAESREWLRDQLNERNMR